MLEHVRRNGVAYLALFVALSGTTYAAVKLPANSVGAKQLRKHAVTRGKLARGAVTKATLAKSLSVIGPRGPKGDAGARGGVGPTQAFAFGLLPGAAPSTTPDMTFDERFVKTATAGRLFTLVRGSFSATCTAGGIVQLGIYVDDVPVSASGAPIGTAVNTEISIWGLTAAVPAGTHAVAIRGDCTGGNPTAHGEQTDAAIAAILLGN